MSQQIYRPPLLGNFKPTIRERGVKDITGQKFNSLTAVRWLRNTRYGAEWLCLCDCGTEREVRASNLRSGAVKSCGCKMRSRLRELRTTHGMSRTPEWNSWEAMLKRCRESAHKHFHRYGGRGISVCDRWLSFENFYADMGPRPSPQHSIDRIDNDGNYEPANCRWATAVDQQNNRSTNIVLSLNGRSQSVALWARELGIPENTLRARVRHGWADEDVLLRPVTKRADPGTGRRSRKSAIERRKRRDGNSESHLRLVRLLPCCITGKAGPNDPHHLRCGPAKDERGTGQKATDQWTVPLCRALHDEAHRVGSRAEEAWFRRHGIDDIVELAAALKRVTGDLDAMRRVLWAHMKGGTSNG